jgi:hypothetical protein
MKEKMLVKLERDRLSTRVDVLDKTVKQLEEKNKKDGEEDGPNMNNNQ